MSVIVHAVLITASVAVTRPPPSLPQDGLSNRVHYMPPPNRPVVPRAPREVVRYLTFAPGIGLGPGRAAPDPEPGIATLERSNVPGPPRPTPAPEASVAQHGDPNADSVFTELQVDSVVVRAENSAAPAYPLDLLERHVEGMVVMRYVVDTTGFADTTSFEVLRSTDTAFVRAVREALPYMRFSPAKIGPHKVRQLVEQGFTFRISPTLAGTPKP